MIKKLIFSLILLFHAATVNAAEMVNVEYIHKLINREWDIDLLYNPKLENPKVAANMKYLLTAIDRANEIANGTPTTSYGTGQYATMAAADTIAIGGHVTRYANGSFDTAISFSSSASVVASVSGSLGKILPYIPNKWNSPDWTKGNPTRPQFYRTFYQCKNLKTVPDTLFSGINGTGAAYAFDSVFMQSGIETIPENLFNNAGINDIWGAGGIFNNAFNEAASLKAIPAQLFAFVPYPQPSFFSAAFTKCTGLTEVPAGLFATVRDKPGASVYASVFSGYSGIRTIPDELFAGLEGDYTVRMVSNAFNGCSSLTSIPRNLFGTKLTGTPYESTFTGMFNGCTSLSGPSARINGEYLYKKWAWNWDGWASGYMTDIYRDAAGLTDWDAIPSTWK